MKEFNFLGLIFDSNLNWKAHLTGVANKVSRIIGLLHKLKYFFPSYILIMIYNSLILPHFNYSLLAWGSKCHKIEILQKKAIRVVQFKSPIAHTEPILKKMNQLKLSDMYTRVRTPPGNLEYSWIFIWNFSGPGKPGEMMLFFEI